MSGPMPDRVLVAGGGVAAVEALLALRELAGDHVEIDVLAPQRKLVQRPQSVVTPFGFGAIPDVLLDEVARRTHAAFRDGALVAVDGPRGVAIAGDGSELAFDHLLVAVGAAPRGAIPGALTFAGPRDAGALRALLERASAGAIKRLVFAAPAGASWTLPLYELAIMAAMDLRNRGVTGARIAVVTPEQRPLGIFGDVGAAAIERMLAERAIELLCGRRPAAVADGRLLLGAGDDDDEVRADAVVALPVFEGPRIAGLPCDAHGFIPVSPEGRVPATERVLAAGDATSFPIKQGGLATQQADAAAQTIASDLGVAAEPGRFRPVLRGLLMTGDAPVYLRAELSPGAERDPAPGTRELAGAVLGEASGHALWWPPAKVAGRYLAPYLSTARPAALGEHPMEDRYARRAPPSTDRDEAFALALLMAEEDARMGDYRQAVHAIDAAAALVGGALPAGVAAKRDAWAHGQAVGAP
jgi:sulfide:quinone oxidoreductase